MNNKLHDERELLGQLAEGDEKAFRAIFDQYRDHIYSVAFTFTKSVVLSEEIVQDVFVKLWTKRAQLPAVKEFQNWLFIVARNHIYNELNKKINQPSFVAELKDYFAGSPSADTVLLEKESVRILAAAVAGLSEQQQLIYRLSREEGLSHEQISERLQISKNTVKVHMSRALHHIRVYLEAHARGLVLVWAVFRAFL